MKIFKRVYLIALPVLLVLVMAFGFVHAFSGGRAYKLADGFTGAAATYAENLDTRGNYSTNPNKTDESEKIRTNIVYYLSSTGERIQLKSVTTEANTDKRDAEGNILLDENDEPLSRHSIVKYNNVAAPEMSYYNLGTNGYTVSDQTIQAIADKHGNSTYIPVDRIINNLTVVVPGQKTKDNAQKYQAHLDWMNANPDKTTADAAAAGNPVLTADDAADAILITAHMDFARGAAGGADMATLGTVLNEIYELRKFENASENKTKAKYQNDIIFLFTDSRYDASYGIYTFLEQFYGFETRENYSALGKQIIPDIVSRIKLCVNLDSIGGGDSAILLQTSKNNANAVKGFTKAVGAVSSSFVSDVYANFPSDFNGFGDITSVNLVTFGDLKNRNTQYETLDKVSESVYAKKAQMLIGTLDYFGDYDLDKFDSDKTVKYFSVLGLFTINYTDVVSYVFGALVLLLILMVILVNRKKKAFKFSSMGKGILVQLLSISAALLAMFALYFILGLLLAGFGLFTIHSLATFAYTNIGIMVGYIVLAAALTGLFYGIFKRLLGIKAPDIVRGGAAIWAVLGAVLAFAYPALGLMAAISAMLVMLTTLLSTLYKEKFKNKFGFDIERMFFYLIPMVFALILFTPSFAILAVSVRALLMPIVILPFIMALAFIMPYAAALKPAMDRLLAKMPKRTVRVQRTVTERVADKAKPGKFTEVTSTKIVKEKIAWKYRNGVGMAVIAVIACVVIMASSALGVPFGGATYVNNKDANFGVNRLTESIYDSSLLLIWSRTGISTNAAKTTLEIHDKAAYKHLRGTIAGYKWDTDKNAYVKPYDDGITSVHPTFENASGANRVRFDPAEFPGLGRGISEVVIYDASSITKITVMDSSGNALEDNARRKEVYANDGGETITLRLPTDADKNGGKYEGFILEFEFNSSKPSSFTIALNQYIWDTTGDALGNIIKDAGDTDVTEINSYMGKLNNDAAKASMKFGIVFNLEKTISI